MAIRTDIYTIDWSVSPRLVWIDISVTEASALDLYDTLAHLQALPDAMDEQAILSPVRCEGKAYLSPGIKTGLTVSLVNAQYAFAARPGPEWVICNMGGGNVVAKLADDETDLYPRYPTAYVSADRTTSSSATLQEQEAIVYGSFNYRVTIDVVNGFAGYGTTSEPVGTRQRPSNNLVDAAAIALAKGFDTYYIVGDLEIVTGNFNGKRFIGESVSRTMLELGTDAQLMDCEIMNASINGVLDGNSTVMDCFVGTLHYVSGQISNSGLYGGIYLAGDKNAVISNCYTINQDSPPFIDMGDSGQSLSMPNYSGLITICNLSDVTQEIGIGINAGAVILDSTITGGTIIVSGVGLLEDNSSNTIVNTDGLINKNLIADSLLNTVLTSYTTANTVASSLRNVNFDSKVTVDAINGVAGTEYPLGTIGNPVNNMSDAMVIATNEGLTKIYVIGDYTFTAADTISGLDIYGTGKQRTHLTFTLGTIIPYCRIREAYVTGPVVGVIGYRDCHIIDISSPGLVPLSTTIIVQDCLIQGTIAIPSNYTGELIVLDSWMVPDGTFPVLDMNGAAFSLQMRNLSGFMSIINSTQPNQIRIFFNNGGLRLDSSVTAGNFVLTGTANLTDESTSVTSLDKSALLNKEELTRAQWKEVYIDPDGNPGTDFPLGTMTNPVSNIGDALAIADRENIHILHLHGEHTLPLGIEDKFLVGHGALETCILHLNDQVIDTVCFEHLVVKGKLRAEPGDPGGGWAPVSSKVEFVDCYLQNVEDLEGVARNCQIEGDTKIKSGGWFSSVATVIEGDNTVFDLRNTTETSVSMDMESGWAQFINSVAGCLVELNVKGGEVSFEASCVGGEYYLEGVGTLFNDGAMTVKENHLPWDEQITYHQIVGSTGEALATGSISPTVIADAVWDAPVADHQDDGSTGKALVNGGTRGFPFAG